MRTEPLDYLKMFRAAEHGESLIESAPERVHQLIATHHLRSLLDAAAALVAVKRIACCDHPDHRRGWLAEDDSGDTFMECRNCEMQWSSEEYELLTKPGGPFA